MNQVLNSGLLLSLDALSLGLLLFGALPWYREGKYKGKSAKGMDSSSTAATIYSVAIFLIFSLVGFSLTWNIIIAVSIWWPMRKILKKREMSKAKKEFDANLGEGLQIISNSLRAGLTLKDALRASVKSAPKPFSIQIELILQDLNIGIPMAEALEKASRKIDTDNAGLAFGSMLISSRTGGDLPSMLEKIIHTVGQRERIRGKLKALTAQGRMQAILVCSAPPLLFIFMYWFDKSRIQLLLDQTLGQILLGLAVFLELVGIFVTKKVMKLNL